MSSKSGEGFKKLVQLFGHLEKGHKQTKSHKKPKVFVVGTTNVGKSTFLNRLVDKTNYHPGYQQHSLTPC